MERGKAAGAGGAGSWKASTAKGGVQVTPRALLSWNSSITNSLLRNMFPANLVEATFKQVSGFLGDGGWAGRASLGLAWLVSLPVSGGGMLCLCILEINPLSVASFAIIFSILRVVFLFS